VAAAISAAIGKPVKFVNVDDADLRQAMAGAPPKLTELMSLLMGYVRANYTGSISPDVEKLLGRKPTSFAQFAKDHADAWK
jgi:(4-alkanoyl-5-oxo-2,5-dihydrofuran-3-yl)methyl phosphate reductase